MTANENYEFWPPGASYPQPSEPTVQVRGEQDPLLLPPPDEPMAVARVLADARYRLPTDELTLRSWRGGWWRWEASRWAEVEHRDVRAAAYTFTEHALYDAGKAGEKPWAPTRYKVANLLEALAAVTHLDDHTQQPAWIDAGTRGTRTDNPIVACANGLLDVRRRVLLNHTPLFFNQTAVPFPYEPESDPPHRWLRFLGELWPGDGEQIAALQEWMGYVLSGRTNLQKILLIVGPTRAGKGAIARVLGAMIGRENVAGPTLSSLSGEFGLAPLLGKPLAVVSDARLNSRDSNVVVERLLSVSGEDLLTVNRKYREQWTGTLPSRFMLLTNELPELGDASAAIAGRFLTLLLVESWINREDHELEPALHAELAGILNWALDGLTRLEEQGRFTRPQSTDVAYQALVDLASPVKAFIRDRCDVGGQHEVGVDELYTAWKAWAEENGHGRITKQKLGRNLRAAVPGLKVVHARDGDARQRIYQGIGVRA